MQFSIPFPSFSIAQLDDAYSGIDSLPSFNSFPTKFFAEIETFSKAKKSQLKNLNPKAGEFVKMLLSIKNTSMHNGSAKPINSRANTRLGCEQGSQEFFDKLKVVSVNCACRIIREGDDQKFIKVQLSPSADPLIKDVLILKLLELYYNKYCDKNQIRYIFPTYKDHYLLRDTQNVCRQVLETSIAGAESLHDTVKSSQSAKFEERLSRNRTIRREIDEMMRHYIKIAVPTQFAHNDLHANNILFDDNTFNIIDFGRSYMNVNNNDRIRDFIKPNMQDLQTAFTLFNYTQPQHLLDLQTAINIDNPFLISQHGFMCDLAMVSLYLAVTTLFDHPNYLYITFDSAKSAIININLTQSSQYPIDDCLSIGLAWAACYIQVLYHSKNITNVNDPLVEGQIPDTPLCFRLRDIYNIYLLSNLSFIPKWYNTYAIQVHDMFSKKFPSFHQKIYGTQRAGGQPSNPIKQSQTSYTQMEYTTHMKAMEAWLQENEATLVQPFNNIHYAQWVDNKNQLPDPIELVNPEQYTMQPQTRVQFPPENPAAPAAGGAKVFKIFTDATTKRKFIRKANARWYLDQHRGKYRYVGNDKKKIMVLGQAS